VTAHGVEECREAQAENSSKKKEEKDHLLLQLAHEVRSRQTKEVDANANEQHKTCERQRMVEFFSEKLGQIVVYLGKLLFTANKALQ